MGYGDKNKKVAIAGVASVLLVACVVAVTVSIANMGGSDEVTISTKEVEAICSPTDYKETCKNSLSGAKNTDPKELVKTAFEVTMKNISDAISRSELLKKAAKDPRTSDALDLCKTLLNNSIGDLEKSFDAAGDFDVEKILEYANDLKVWLSGPITQQQTCLDAFENTTGDTGEKMKHLLKISGELTSNGLAIITDFTEASSTLEPTNSRRLLSDKDGFPAFISATARRLLNANAGSIKPNVVVAKDGSGQFKSINDAINNAPPPPKNDAMTPYVIKIKAGVYKEYVVVPKKMTHVVFIGDGPTKTKITGNKNKVDGIGTYETATVAIEGEHFIARDIMFENSAGAQKHQAVALRASADHAIFHNCAIDGYQDTLYAHAYRQYYRDCSISGTIDFIFGDASAVFQNCKMIVREPLANQACMVTAQGRMEKRGVGGIVLQNCEILPAADLKTVKPPAQVFLGRPWKQYARTLIAESYIDGFIAPEGWSPWNGNLALDTLWYAEYQNRGPGSDTSKRVNWKGYLKNISPQEVSKFTAGVYIQADQWIKPTGIPYDLA